MDKIILNNMVFHAFHGAMEEEQRLGQLFYLDAVLFVDLKTAGDSDDVNDTIHYGLVYEKIKEIMEKERYNLIEALAQRICSVLLEGYSTLEKIQVTIRKPSAPVAGIFDYMGVEITRTRGES
ncbi:dihydroneopterin aldolase [Parasporobacterium paucivorans]|uniref:7,8-dihydroneopterin aldolase n=1 Tax=Parasporobacterium paucivorans DSM 15970 TaxID=1122934 RepID=A0A1M6FWB2_9FIRM|nr:dihydroneopterin aldolase [Parasporobacterium paucivorans]SHJ01972.1 dihydroneopterin aldolase [Parasporobacterium paucivorans DSM 15970]